ncbi:hypothetical protein OE88DRAFT_1272793 [Heliocybe sulcata]|uniref:Uncharacterized protein n=1 Tax=Heliocybe sulcata TaxID=5364 RepID=A0A5C3NJC2_9AGAM|nr:hypothetical protein OE88DRAFT_1272793 [Heliocybe sulcata]
MLSLACWTRSPYDCQLWTTLNGRCFTGRIRQADFSALLTCPVVVLRTRLVGNPLYTPVGWKCGVCPVASYLLPIASYPVSVHVLCLLWVLARFTVQSITLLHVCFPHRSSHSLSL